MCQSEFVSICGLLCLAGCGATSGADGELAQTSGRALVVTPETIDFGDVQSGSRHDATVTLENPSGQSFRIARIESSCDCVSLELTTDNVGIAESVDAVLSFDLSHEPSFQGGLMVDVTGFDPDEQRLFAISVLASP